jgi:hypothetical protein
MANIIETRLRKLPRFRKLKANVASAKKEWQRDQVGYSLKPLTAYLLALGELDAYLNRRFLRAMRLAMGRYA